jgi:hypothetical protein
MTFIAILLIIALAAFVVTIGFIIAVALNFRKVPTRIMKIVAAPQASTISLINTGKGIAEAGKRRYDGYVKHGTRIVETVQTTSEQVGAAAKSVNVEEAASTLKSVAASLDAAQDGLAAAKAILNILSKSSGS